jgi:spermidine synthase
VIWNRQFTPILHTSVYAFGLILSFYLISNSLGLAWYRYSRRRGWLVSIRLLAAILFFACVAQLWLGDPRLHLGILGVILSVSTISLVLGYLTARQIDDLTGGDPIRAGRAYAVNMLGCIVGPLAAAYVLLPFIGTHLSIVVLALPVLPFLIGGREKASFIFFGTAVAAVLLAFSTPFARTYEEFLPGTFKVIKYDYNATVVAATRPTGEKELIVNGVPMTTLTPITKVMAHLPLALLDQPPESALILCLGMGTTFRSASAWGITTTAVELTPSVAAFFPYFFADAGRVLADPRHRIVVDDGRRYLERTSGRYDLIVIDPPPPVEAAGSSLLYSQQFYALAKGRMTNGGILAQWFPGARGADLDAVITALRAVFPYVAAYSSVEGWGYHLFASQEPIPDLTPDEFAAKLSPAAAKDLMEWNPFGDPDLHAFAARIVAGRQNIESIVSDPHSQAVVTDDRPFTEYYLLRSVWGSAP